MKIRPIKSDDLNRYLEESRGLERDYMAEVLRSRQIAWRLAIGSSFLLAVALLALLFLTPLKTNTPFVLRVDNVTGHVEVLTTIREQESSYGEVVDSYFLNQYVLNREGYDYNTIQNAYNTTALLSDPEVQREYYALFEGAQARDTILKDRAKIIVQVRSITPTPETGSPGTDVSGGTAVVRFSTQLKHSNGSLEPLQNWIATIGYTYKDATMSSVDRRINPLGFQITSYRVDPETLTPSALTSPTSP
jgi:type IV secretion system protein VirB8